jgi:hypothetical protein
MASKHNLRAKPVGDAMRDELASLVNRTGLFYQTKVKEILNLAKSPPASSPGQPPHKRTGTLGRSFRTMPTRKVGRRIILTLGTDVVYARPLEYGTSRMAARPFLGPTYRNKKHRAAVDREIAKVSGRIRAAIRRKAGPPR